MIFRHCFLMLALSIAVGLRSGGEPSSVYLRTCSYLTVDPVAKRCCEVALGQKKDSFLYHGARRCDVACLALFYAVERACKDEPGADYRSLWTEIAQLQQDDCGTLLKHSGVDVSLVRNEMYFEGEVVRIVAEHEERTSRFLSDRSAASARSALPRPMLPLDVRVEDIMEKLQNIGFADVVLHRKFVSDNFCDDFLFVLCDLGLHPMRYSNLLWISVARCIMQRLHGLNWLHGSFNLGKHMDASLAPVFDGICCRLERCAEPELAQHEPTVGMLKCVEAVEADEKPGKPATKVNRRFLDFLFKKSDPASPAANVPHNNTTFAAWLSDFLSKYKEKFDRRVLALLASF